MGHADLSGADGVKRPCCDFAADLMANRRVLVEIVAAAMRTDVGLRMAVRDVLWPPDPTPPTDWEITQPTEEERGGVFG